MNRVRYETDNKDANGISNHELVSYFNDAQRYITTLIFKNNPYADQFKVQVELPASVDGTYTIPTDCYSTSAISMVEARWNTSANNEGYGRIKPIAESEAAYIFGYYIRNNKVIITGDAPNANFSSIRITYFKRLKTLDLRQGSVAAVTPNVSFQINPVPTDIYLMDDHACLVDNQGIQVVGNVYFTNTSGSSMLTTTTSGIAIGQYMVAGKDSQNASELPDECETYLVDYVKQRIYTRNNYEDAGKQMFFTEQQREEIISIFSKNKKDDDVMPISDLTYMSF